MKIGMTRPQIFLAILGLIFLGGYGLHVSNEPATIGALTGIVALAKDVLSIDNKD